LVNGSGEKTTMTTTLRKKRANTSKNAWVNRETENERGSRRRSKS
jgi:hypothetical protein